MVFPLAAAVTRRRVGMIAKQQVQKRSMGGHAPAPEWTGIDKVVRGVFPHDHQLALAIIGGYVGLFVVAKAGSAMGGKKKTEAPAAAPTSSGPSTGVPSIDSPEFDKFLGSEAFDKLLSSDEELGKVLADMK